MKDNLSHYFLPSVRGYNSVRNIEIIILTISLFVHMQSFNEIQETEVVITWKYGNEYMNGHLL